MQNKTGLTAAQARVARGGLGLSLEEAEAASGVASRTIHRLERGEVDRPIARTVTKLRAAYERLGVQFLRRGVLLPASEEEVS